MQKYKTVADYLNGLDIERRAQVDTLRHILLDTAPSLNEHIKWNAPSYVHNGEDRITFNTANKDQVVKLVFHMGAIRKEDKNGRPVLENAALIEWVSNIRGYMNFNSLEAIEKQAEEIKRTVGNWLTIL